MWELPEALLTFVGLASAWEDYANDRARREQEVVEMGTPPTPIQHLASGVIPEHWRSRGRASNRHSGAVAQASFRNTGAVDGFTDPALGSCRE
jgi:hypothetical protein